MRKLPRMGPGELEGAEATPLPSEVAKMSNDKREEMQRAGGIAWVGPVGSPTKLLPPPLPAHMTAGYSTPARGAGRYMERQHIFATEASNSLTSFEGSTEWAASSKPLHGVR